MSRPRTSSQIVLNGVGLVPHPSGALYWPDRETLVVADLHFEKGSAFARRGQLLPPYDTSATLGLLEKVVRDLAPSRVICLGDSFHDQHAAQRMADEDAARIAALTARSAFVWIAGNHDPAPPENLGGSVVETLVDGALKFQHEAAQRPVAGEISGHFHPKASVRTRARRVSARCFISDGRRLILPSFGAFTGGLNVRDHAITRYFPKGFDVWLIGRDRVHRFPGSATEVGPGAERRAEK